jgi:hypothetical protein
MLAGVVPDYVQRGVDPRGDLASGETGREASQHGKLGRAELHDDVAASSVRSRDAAVLLDSAPRSQLGDPFHVTLDVSLESVQARQLRRLESAAGEQRGQRAGEEASGSEGGVQVGRR